MYKSLEPCCNCGDGLSPFECPECGPFLLQARRIAESTSPYRAHLDLYLDEFQFRWNARDMTDEGHTAIAIQGADGKRLTYGARGHPQDARDGGWGCGPCLDDGRSRRAVGDYREVDSAPPTTRRGSWSSVSASGSGGME